MSGWIKENSGSAINKRFNVALLQNKSDEKGWSWSNSGLPQGRHGRTNKGVAHNINYWSAVYQGTGGRLISTSLAQIKVADPIPIASLRKESKIIALLAIRSLLSCVFLLDH